MIPELKTQTDLTTFLRGLSKTADYSTMLREDFGVESTAEDTDAELEFLYKYMVQGKFKAINEADLLAYARKSTKDLFGTLPHLATRGTEEVVESAVSAPAPAKTKTAKAPKVAKVKTAKAPKVAKVAKTVHADGTIFYRADRAKWVAMLNGKQEAARPTVEACKKFLEKKGFDMTKVVVLEAA